MTLRPLKVQLLQRLLLVWIAAIIIGSFLPTGAKQAIGTQVLVEGQVTWDWRHRLFHLFSFGIAGLLVSLIYRDWRRCVLYCAAVFALALSIEIAQCLIYKSGFEWWDVRDDSCGIIVFAALGRGKAVRASVASVQSAFQIISN